MRHRKSGIKLGRTTSHRQAMFRNMVTSLFKYERIRTTDVKAKELRRWADHIITLAKVGDLHARRQVMAIVREKDVVHKLFEDAEKRFGKINGGYTRIVKIGTRPGDSAPVSLVELVSTDEAKPKAKKKSKSQEKVQQPEPIKPEKEDTAEVSGAAPTDQALTSPEDTEKPTGEGNADAIEASPVKAETDQQAPQADAESKDAEEVTKKQE